ncbi:cupin domain-containing protein [Lentisphaerota bacterium ZTH]|nr:cupin domain-containing protein [Lentisphaerota bacterium]WET05109.1 cupin domain-containing protein [Lentisphaerota bacterium ZTH]
MKVVNIRETDVMINPHGINAKKIYDTENAQVMHITLQSGESLIRHITPVDVFFYVLEGIGIVEIGDEKQKVGPDTLIESSKDIPHCWYNDGEGVLRILVVKVPRPTTPTKFV